MNQPYHTVRSQRSSQHLAIEQLEQRCLMDGAIAHQPSDILERFGTDDAIEQFLIDRGGKQYGYLLGQPAYYYGVAYDGDLAKAYTGGAGSASPNFSGTNVQVLPYATSKLPAGRPHAQCGWWGKLT